MYLIAPSPQTHIFVSHKHIIHGLHISTDFFHRFFFPANYRQHSCSHIGVMQFPLQKCFVHPFKDTSIETEG